jgi:pimeloyl-ACP methyl ester carboxylesterase
VIAADPGVVLMKKAVLSNLLMLALMLILMVSSPHKAIAQGDGPTPVAAQKVQIAMSDGLNIIGNYYPALSSEAAPAVLLLHATNGKKEQWDPLIPQLTAHGYHVLAIDERSFGETGGTKNQKAAITDIPEVMTWLRTQNNVDGERVAIIGADDGATLGIKTCGADKQCHVAIALSPTLQSRGIKSEETVQTLKKDKALLLVATQSDVSGSNAVRRLLDIAPRPVNVMARLYGASNKHGVELLGMADINIMMLDWLDSYNVKPADTTPAS